MGKNKPLNPNKDYCVVCGFNYVPEGSMICKECSDKYDNEVYYEKKTRRHRQYDKKPIKNSKEDY